MGEAADVPVERSGSELSAGADVAGAEPRADDSPADASSGGGRSLDGDGEPRPTRVFSGYGIASTILVLASVALIVLGLFLWSAYRRAANEHDYKARVMTAAAEWARTFISTTGGDLDANFRHLRERTTGALNADFDAELQPYREVLHKHIHSVGRIEAVAIEPPQSRAEHDAATEKSASPAPASPAPAPPNQATRTDTVMVIAASVSQDGSPKPQRMPWNLLLDVSNVGGKLLISRMVTVE